MLARPGLEVVQVHIAPGRARHHDHAEAGGHGAGGIGAVRRGGDEHDVTVRLVPVALVGANHHEAGELALGARVGLQRHGSESSDGGERPLEFGDHAAVAWRLLHRRERVDRGEFGPADRQHRRHRRELHGARPEGNHRPVQADVLALEAADVACHLGLRMMAVEDRMGEERRASHQRAGNRSPTRRRRRGGRPADGAREHPLQHPHVVARRGLVERHADVGIAVDAQVDPRGGSFGREAPERVGPSGQPQLQRVEVGAVDLLDAQRRQRRLERARQRVDAARDAREPLGAVVHGVHRRHVRRQRLRRTDVGGRLLAPDVLLARLERHAVGRAALGVLGDADQAPRHLAHVLGRVARNAACGPPAPMGSPNRCALPTTMSAPMSPGGVRSVRAEQVGGDGHAGAGLVGAPDERRRIVGLAVVVGVCKSAPKTDGSKRMRSGSTMRTRGRAARPCPARLRASAGTGASTRAPRAGCRRRRVPPASGAASPPPRRPPWPRRAAMRSPRPCP